MRQKPRKKGKRTRTYSSLKRELDKVFSEFIRLRDMRENNGSRCFTCGLIPLSWRQLQCGHYVSRVHLSTRWNERNCAAQCYACNVLRRGNPAEFTLALQAKYGPGIVQELVDLKRQSVKFSRSELQDLIEGYEARLGVIS